MLVRPTVAIAAFAAALAGCEPGDAPKTAAERACALNAMSHLGGIEVTSTSIQGHDPYEVARGILTGISNADAAIQFAIDFDSFDWSKRSALKAATSGDQFAEILHKTVAPNLAESKLVTFKISRGGVSGAISAYCGVSRGGTVRTALRRGLG